MTVWHVDLAGGSEANDGLSWSSPKLTPKSIPVASIAPGDEVRIAKSPDPALVGTATWTHGSTSVVLAAESPSLLATDFASRSSEPYWGSSPWRSVASVTGTAVTLNKPYRGESGSFPMYRRSAVRLPGLTGVLIGFGAAGGTSVNGYPYDRPAAGSPRITISGGWNTTTGLLDGQTLVDAVTRQAVALRLHAFGVDVSHLSFARFAYPGLDGYVVPDGVCEIDQVIEWADYFTYGSGNTGGGTLRINAITGSLGQGLHIHSSWNNRIEVGKIYDSQSSAISQNNDYPTQVGGVFRLGEVAYNGGGIGFNSGGGGSARFNIVSDTDWIVDSIHDNGYGGMGLEITGSNTFTIRDSYANVIDMDFASAPSANPSWVQTLVASSLRSPTRINNPLGLPVVERRITATAGTPSGNSVVLSGSRVLGSTITVTRR